MSAQTSFPYIEKELSWLSFNERVLQEAADPKVPVIERVRFLGIYSNNQDEFFRVRVADVRRQILIDESKGRGQRARNLLAAINDKVLELQVKFDEIYKQLLLDLARRKHPSGPNSLDALCSRYGIDNSKRIKHGALLDAEILAEVYLELIGGRQTALGLITDEEETSSAGSSFEPGELGTFNARQRPSPLQRLLQESELEAHKAFIEISSVTTRPS